MSKYAALAAEVEQFSADYRRKLRTLESFVVQQRGRSIMIREQGHIIGPAFQRPPHPSAASEKLLRIFEANVWPAYCPGQALELRWEPHRAGQRVLGETRWDAARQLWSVTVAVTESLRDDLETLLHETAHVRLNHIIGNGVPWPSLLDQRLDTRQALMEAARQARPSATAPACRGAAYGIDIEHEAQVWATRELARLMAG